MHSWWDNGLTWEKRWVSTEHRWSTKQCSNCPRAACRAWSAVHPVPSEIKYTAFARISSSSSSLSMSMSESPAGASFSASESSVSTFLSPRLPDLTLRALAHLASWALPLTRTPFPPFPLFSSPSPDDDDDDDDDAVSAGSATAARNWAIFLLWVWPEVNNWSW